MLKKLLFSMAVFIACSRGMAMGGHGDWIFSGGMGLTISPTLFLINPSLEYVVHPGFTIGPNIQMGLGDGGVLFTGSGIARFTIGNHPRVKPTLEAGMGLAFASSLFSTSIGVHIVGGMGMDYRIDKTMSIGTMVRANFAPPLKTFFASWPLFIFRVLI